MKLTGEQVVIGYGLLRAAELSKCKPTTALSVVKAVRVFKPIAIAYEDALKDAQEQLKGQNHDQMVEMAQILHRDGDKAELTAEEIKCVEEYFGNYSSLMNEAMRTELLKEHELEYPCIDEESLASLIEGNSKWNVEQIMLISDIICK